MPTDDSRSVLRHMLSTNPQKRDITRRIATGAASTFGRRYSFIQMILRDLCNEMQRSQLKQRSRRFSTPTTTPSLRHSCSVLKRSMVAKENHSVIDDNLLQTLTSLRPEHRCYVSKGSILLIAHLASCWGER